MVIIDRLWEMLQLVVVNELCLIGKQQQNLLIKHYYKTANIKCTKQHSIHVLTATFKYYNIENSKKS